MEELEKLYELTIKKKEIEEEIKTLNESILNEIHDVKCLNVNLENENIKISYIPESEYTSLDLTKVKNKEPDLYNELLDVYPKTVKRKEYLKVKIK